MKRQQDNKKLNKLSELFYTLVIAKITKVKNSSEFLKGTFYIFFHFVLIKKLTHKLKFTKKCKSTCEAEVCKTFSLPNRVREIIRKQSPYQGLGFGNNIHRVILIIRKCIQIESKSKNPSKVHCQLRDAKCQTLAIVCFPSQFI